MFFKSMEQVQDNISYVVDYQRCTRTLDLSLALLYADNKLDLGVEREFSMSHVYCVMLLLCPLDKFRDEIFLKGEGCKTRAIGLMVLVAAHLRSKPSALCLVLLTAYM